VTGGGAYFTKVSGSSASLFYGYMSTSYGYTSNPVVGRRYRIVVRAKTSTGGGYLRTYDGAGGYPLITTSVDTTMRTYTFDFTCQHATGCFIYGNASYADGQILYFDRYEVYELTPWLDVSGHGHDATPEGIDGLTIESGTDKRGQGLKYFDFDGSNDLISTSFGSGLNPTTTLLSYALWVYPDTASGGQMFMAQSSWGASARAYFGHTGGSWGMGIQAAGWGGHGGAVVASTWHHIVIVFDGSNAKWYQNGNHIFTYSYTSYAFDMVLALGNGSTYSSGYPWDGKIATCAVYQIALTAAQIKQNFNTQRSRFGV